MGRGEVAGRGEVILVRGDEIMTVGRERFQSQGQDGVIPLREAIAEWRASLGLEE